MSGTLKVQVEELSQTSNSLPVPKRGTREEVWFYDSQFVAKGFPAKVNNKTDWEYDLIEPSPLPRDEEFTLSAFGLPEPPTSNNDAPIRWYLWLGLAGIGCILLAAYVHFQKRRRTSSEYAPAKSRP